MTLPSFATHQTLIICSLYSPTQLHNVQTMQCCTHMDHCVGNVWALSINQGLALHVLSERLALFAAVK